MNGTGTLRLLTHWIPLSVVGALILFAVSSLFKIPDIKEEAARIAVPKIQILGNLADKISSEDASLNDPTPLFLPTRYSVSQLNHTHMLPQGDFSGFSPKLAFSTEHLALNIATPTVVPDRPVDALAIKDPSNPAYGLGRTDRLHTSLKPRVAWVRVSSMASGRAVLELALLAKDTPNAPSDVMTHAWKPLQFSVAVDAAGLLGPILSTERSGSPADVFFLDYLTHTMRIADRLPPGFYQISVGP